MVVQHYNSLVYNLFLKIGKTEWILVETIRTKKLNLFFMYICENGV